MKRQHEIMHSLPRDAGRKYGIPSDRCQGGNGYVYKCKRKSDGVICAVKVLKNLRGDGSNIAGAGHRCGR